MDIDTESIALLSLVLRDAPKDCQLILCILARSNQVPSPIKFHSNTEYPTFYGYSNERMPFFLMGKGIISNVPREGYTKRLISSHYLSYAETIINKAKNWSRDQQLMSVSKFITLDNRTTYKDAEVFLVFRDKAQNYISDYVHQNKEHISNFLRSKLGRFEFGNKLLSQKEELSDKKNLNPKTRYNQILDEIKSNNRKSDLNNRYNKLLTDIKGIENKKIESVNSEIIDFTDTTSRKGYEKKWDVLQTMSVGMVNCA